MKLFKRVSLVALSTVTALGTALAYYPGSRIHAADDFRGRLQNVQSVVLDESDNNIVYINYNDNVTAKVTFLEDGIFRFNVDPTGEFSNMRHLDREVIKPEFNNTQTNLATIVILMLLLLKMSKHIA